MTPEQVEQAVRRIFALVQDRQHADAHAAEDTLREDVLEAIASGAPNAADLARLALLTSEMSIEHWFA